MTFPRGLAPWKNSTFVTLPSESEAVAVRVKEAGAANTEPFGGLVKTTVGGTLAAATVIVPIIKGWTVQWNGKLPGAVNVRLNVCPVPKTPESHRPVSLVVV